LINFSPAIVYALSKTVHGLHLVSYRIVSYDFEDFLSYPFNKQTRGCENNTATESGEVSISVRRHHLNLKYKTETKNETNAKNVLFRFRFSECCVRIRNNAAMR